MADEGRKGTDELKDALEQLRRAADKVAERVMGSEVTGHLRQAAQHVVRAARSALDQVDRSLGEKKTPAQPADRTTPP